jgi:hypothetical protein
MREGAGGGDARRRIAARDVSNVSVFNHAAHDAPQDSLLSHAEGRQPYTMASDYVQVNNVFYDRGNTFNRLGSQRDIATLNSFVGNVYVNGPSLHSWASGKKPIDITSDFELGGKLYLSDNIVVNHSFTVNAQWDLVDNNTPYTQAQLQVSSPPVWNTGLAVKPSSEVFDWVLDNAGARPADRLPYETRIINNARNGTGGIVNSVAEAGGWPVVAENYRALTVPANPNGDDDGDGYTNVEEWLHAFAAEVEGSAGSCNILNLSVNSGANGADEWAVAANLQEGDLT